MRHGTPYGAQRMRKSGLANSGSAPSHERDGRKADTVPTRWSLMPALNYRYSSNFRELLAEVWSTTVTMEQCYHDGVRVPARQYTPYNGVGYSAPPGLSLLRFMLVQDKARGLESSQAVLVHVQDARALSQ
ncbi:hypothetical protein MKX08_003123 [Trichoderma sp. CBMAI-0020]|nr:hypothetical protein MKX08_003123 [Trichoderma sp. CBMAI-0020]